MWLSLATGKSHAFPVAQEGVLHYDGLKRAGWPQSTKISPDPNPTGLLTLGSGEGLNYLKSGRCQFHGLNSCSAA